MQLLQDATNCNRAKPAASKRQAPMQLVQDATNCNRAKPAESKGKRLGSAPIYASVKGLCHEMNIFLKPYKKYMVLSLHALIVFITICFLVDIKIKLEVLACSFEITY
jgi:hypothetical protein